MTVEFWDDGRDTVTKRIFAEERLYNNRQVTLSKTEQSATSVLSFSNISPVMGAQSIQLMHQRLANEVTLSVQHERLNKATIEDLIQISGAKFYQGQPKKKLTKSIQPTEYHEGLRKAELLFKKQQPFAKRFEQLISLKTRYKAERVASVSSHEPTEIKS
jgi:hypothetical protein